MYRMTSEVVVAGKRILINDVKWKMSVTNIFDACTITIPLKGNCVDVLSAKEGTKKESLFKNGDSVVVKLGYNGVNALRFSGFVSNVVIGVPIVIECEGWAYKLRHKSFTASYRKTTITQIMAELVTGTGIILSTKCANVPVEKVTFKSAPALKVIEWLQKELMCSVSFYGNELYVGPSRFGVPGVPNNLRIGWNTVNCDLKPKRESNEVQINIVSKEPAGSTKKIKAENKKYSNIKEIKVRDGLPPDYLTALLKEMQTREDYRGCEGSITAFLVPTFSKGDVVNVSDGRFGTRSGRYFVESIDGSFGAGGGRQKLKLVYYGK